MAGQHSDGKGGSDTPPSPYSSPEQQGDGQVPKGVLDDGDGKHKKPKDDD
ncbi:hypothetical protein [Streptomyces mayteni]